MNISPVSFGRAIRVNTTPEVANELARAANVKTPTNELQKYAKSIFDDTSIHKAKVVVIEPNEVYIFSGKEAKSQTEISKDLRKKVKANNDLVKMLPLREVREERKHQAEVENYNLAYSAIYKMRSLVEDGINGRPFTTLDILSRTVKSQFFGNYDEIYDSLYTSNRDGKKEIMQYKA